MSIHTRTKHAKNDTKAIERDTVSSKNVKNQYGFVLPSLTLLLHTPRGASAKAVLWITWPQKARQTAQKMRLPENENATYVKNSSRFQVPSLVPGSEFRVPGFKACPVFVWSRFPAAL
jgi:hypothetical protein